MRKLLTREPSAGNRSAASRTPRSRRPRCGMFRLPAEAETLKVELHVNGSHQVILVPETKIERAILAEMVDSAGKGRAVRVTGSIDFDMDTEIQLKSVTFGVEA